MAEEFQKAFAGMNGAETLLYQKPEQKAEGKYQLDLWLANQLWLTDAGITPEHLEVTNVCTAHNPAYLFSHRKTNGKRGNLGAFLCLKENGQLETATQTKERNRLAREIQMVIDNAHKAGI